MRILPDFVLKSLSVNKYISKGSRVSLGKVEVRKSNPERKRLSGKNQNNSGQALLIILLLMSVVLTIVLSTVSRSVTDITITTYEEDSARAFSAAEAGIEEALLRQTTIAFPGDVGEEHFEVDFPPAEPLAGNFEYPEDLSSGEVATIWFVEVRPDGTLTCDGGTCSSHGGAKKIQELCWGTGSYAGNSEWPALQMAIYWDSVQSAIAATNDYSNINVTRVSFDENTSRRAKNGFLDPNDTGAACSIVSEFNFKAKNVDLDDPPPGGLGIPCADIEGCLIMAKLRLVYNTKKESVGVNMSGWGLPAQGRIIESTGTGVNTTRKVRVLQGNPIPPPIFESAIFSNTSIIK